jgi:hypothetical protein
MWVNDKANGQGTYTHSNGAKFTGSWRDDLQNGYGEESWVDGSDYKGEYDKG